MSLETDAGIDRGASFLPAALSRGGCVCARKERVKRRGVAHTHALLLHCDLSCFAKTEQAIFERACPRGRGGCSRRRMTANRAFLSKLTKKQKHNSRQSSSGIHTTEAGTAPPQGHDILAAAQNTRRGFPILDHFLLIFTLVFLQKKGVYSNYLVHVLRIYPVDRIPRTARTKIVQSRLALSRSSRNSKILFFPCQGLVCKGWGGGGQVMVGGRGVLTTTPAIVVIDRWP